MATIAAAGSSPQAQPVLRAAHSLWAQFSPAGTTVHVAREHFTLAPTGIGAGGSVRTLPSTPPERIGGRVVYDRGPLVEWWTAGPRGLEQSFLVKARPADGPGPLTLRLTVSSVMRIAGASAVIADMFSYGGLRATDAIGRALPSWIELSGNHISLEIDDRGARYPVAIDPFVRRASLLSGMAGSGPIGGAIAISGDTIVAGAAGANFGTGLVFVYVKPPGGWSGQPTPSAILEASDGGRGDGFGTSVSVSGNTVVVGAARHRSLGKPVAAAVYVFTRPTGGWSGTLTEDAKLTATGARPGDGFGTKLAIDGPAVVVGSPNHASTGAAYVYVRPSTGWTGTLTQSATLTAATGGTDDEFGESVAVHLATVVVGAPGHNGEQGIAYVFARPSTGWAGTLTETAQLTASGPAQLFGRSVAVWDFRVVVGAPFYEAGKNMDQGAAWVFHRPKAGWSKSLQSRVRLVASSPAKFDQLGVSVAAWGPLLLAGAVHDGFGLNLPPGGAGYVYAHKPCLILNPKPGSKCPSGPGLTLAPVTISPTQELTNKPNGLLGSVALSGNTIVAGSLGRPIFVFVNPAPKITIKVPRKAYKLGAKVTASYFCAPSAPAQLVSCDGTAPRGAPVDTATAGKHSFTVTATDNLGATRRQRVFYLVTAA